MILKQAKEVMKKENVSYQEIHEASLAFRKALKRNMRIMYLDYYQHCMDIRVDYELKTGRIRKDTIGYIYNNLKAGKTGIGGIELNDEVLYKVIGRLSDGMKDKRVKQKTRRKRIQQLEFFLSLIEKEES